MTNLAKTDEETVSEVLAPRIARVNDLTSVGAEINACREYEGICELDVPTILMQHAHDSAVHQAELVLQVRQLGRGLCALNIPTYQEYREGAALTSTAAPSLTAQKPTDVEDHIGGHIKNRLVSIVEAAPQDAAQAGLSLWVGIGLGVIAFLAVAFPFFVGGFGNEGFDGTWNAAKVMNLVTTIGGALTMVAAGCALVFMRGGFVRPLKMAAWLVTLAMVLMALRYVAVHLQVDPDAESAMSPFFRKAIVWVASTGIGVATYLVEFSAGCCLGFYWRDRECRKHLPHAMKILNDIATWDAARVKLAPNFSSIPNAKVVIQVCVDRVADTIEQGLKRLQAFTAEQDSMVSIPSTGATSEAYDLPVLKERIKRCLDARDQLIELSRKKTPPSSSSFEVPSPTIPTL